MPDLSNLFLERDFFFLETTAELWGIEFQAPDLRSGAQDLPALMVNAEIINELLQSFPEEALEALGECAANHGRMQWTAFETKYGSLREMGQARMEREQPYIFPENAAELLWYHALIGRGFFEEPEGLKEFAYIPDDLLSYIPTNSETNQTIICRPAAADEMAVRKLVSTRLIDQAVSLLAGIRKGMVAEEVKAFEEQRSYFPAEELKALLIEAEILDGNDAVNPAKIRNFLEMGSAEAMAQLAQTWLQSTHYSDLSFVPSIEISAETRFDPRAVRKQLLEILTEMPVENWWNIPSLINTLHSTQPEILRTAAELDTWYLRDKQSNQSLRGKEHWLQVEGALIEYLITGPLYWFGFVHLAARDENSQPTAFRLTNWAANLLNGDSPPVPAPAPQKMILDSRGRLFIPPSYSKTARYQVSRFADWTGWKKNRYHYTITASSLKSAEDQGLKVSQLVNLLKQTEGLEIPPNILTALQRFHKKGLEAKLETRVVLKVRDETIIQQLKENRFAAKYIIEQIGPRSLAVSAGAVLQISQMLTEMGWLSTADTTLGEEND